MTHSPRIALIHALSHSVAPINQAFEEHFHNAFRMNLLDDSLSADLAAVKTLNPAMFQRFNVLADYAVSTNADAILFTCSAFGDCIDDVKQKHAAIPVLKPNEAMINDITHIANQNPSCKIGLLATFAPTLLSMPKEFPPQIILRPYLVEHALTALNQQQTDQHDQLIAQAAFFLKQQGCTHIVLSQFSMARAKNLCETVSGLPVYTTVHSAVDQLKKLLTQQQPKKL